MWGDIAARGGAEVKAEGREFLRSPAPPEAAYGDNATAGGGERAIHRPEASSCPTSTWGNDAAPGDGEGTIQHADFFTYTSTLDL